MTTPLPVLGPFVLCLAAAAASAEPIPLAVDMAAFPAAEGGASLEVYVLTPGDGAGAGSRPGPRLHRIEVIGKNGDRVGEASRVVPDSSPAAGRLEVWRFPVFPGELRVRLRIEDLESGDEGTFEGRFRVPDFHTEAFAVSTPVFGVVPAGAREDPGGVDARGGILPVASRRIYSEEDTVAVYLSVSEFHDRSIAPPGGGVPAAVDSSRVVEIQHLLRRGSIEVSEGSARLPLDPEAEYLHLEPAVDLPGGKYRLELRVRLEQELVVREVDFTLPARGRDLLADPVLIRTVLSYVATGEERLLMESAPDDSLEGFWNWFWARRDSGGPPASNEPRDLFVKRVEEAGRRFGGVVPGWRTDRGRIFIRHGEPAQTERVLATAGAPATETWFYGDGGPVYVFKDLDGFGDFRLTGGYRD